jgi:predicted flap endonuclease-1-like 5' DNA nuclease
MSLLQNVLYSNRCTSTHHKLALDSLRHLRGEQAEKWRKLFLKHAESLLLGATAPDDSFKDFRNHVLYVRGKLWVGAVESSETWYQNTVEALRAKKWSKAAYAAGVLSHYYTDPLMPLHTAQSEEANVIHRACERSVFRSYDHLMAILERDLGGYPDVAVPRSPRWLAEMVKAGARLSHGHYDVLIDHYNLVKGRRSPVAGLDDEMRVSLAECLGHAVVGFARILDRAIGESQVAAPNCWIAFAGLRAWFRIPAMRWSRLRANLRSRRKVAAIFKEYRKTGKVIKALPEDEKTVRRLHGEEVLNTSPETLDALKSRPVGTKYGTGTYLRPMVAASTSRPTRNAVDRAADASDSPSPADVIAIGKRKSAGASSQTSAENERPRLAKPVPRLSKFHLDPSSSLADAPSIGNRTAEKLAAVGIKTVAELLSKKPDEVAQRLKLGHIKPDAVKEWQVQARLACRVPNLRALDVKILVACGICEPEELAKCEALDLLDRVDLFISTSEGRRAIRGGGSQPDLDIVSGWIESALHARTLKAA